MGDKGHANAALKTDPFASAPDAAPFPPRAIIAGDENKRIIQTPALFERRHNLPDRIVQTLHYITVKTGIGAPFFRRRGIKRYMGKIMGEIKEKRFLARCLRNKSFRRFGVKGVKRGLVNGCYMAYLLARIRRAANQRERVHIIGIISAEKALKAKLRRHRTGMVAHMPFADHCGFIADRVQNIGNENFLARQAHRIAEKPVEAVKYRARRKRHMGEPGARRHAAGQHGGA